MVAKRFGYAFELCVEIVCVACCASLCGSRVGDMRVSDTSVALIRSCLFTGVDEG